MLRIEANPAGRASLSILFMAVLCSVCGCQPGRDGDQIPNKQAASVPAKVRQQDVNLPSATDTLFTGEQYEYSFKSRRDPFKPMIQKRGEGSGENSVGTLDISNIKLTGVIEGPNGRLGLVHDNEGIGYVIQEGDQLIGGRVLAIKDTNVVFRQEVEKGKYIDFSLSIYRSADDLQLKP
jgi:Tfp pilus assembly protein PilP